MFVTVCPLPSFCHSSPRFSCQGLSEFGNINVPVGPIMVSLPLEFVGLVESDRHVTFLSPQSGHATGSQVFAAKTPVESAIPWNIPDRRHYWSYLALCSSLPQKSISQATSRTSWVPNYRECSRFGVRTMDQVRRVEKELRLVPSLIIILPGLILKHA